MPIYEYHCPECDLKFELLRSISKADEDASCLRCRNVARRVLSRFSSYSKGSNGESTPISGTASSCTGCTASTCSSCH